MRISHNSGKFVRAKITDRGKSIRYKVDRDFLAEGRVHLRNLRFKANLNSDGEDLDEAD